MDKVLEYIFIAAFIGFMLTFVGGFVYFVLLVFRSAVTAPFALVSAARRTPWNAPTHGITRHARAPHRLEPWGLPRLAARQADRRLRGDQLHVVRRDRHRQDGQAGDQAEMEHLVRRVPYLDPPYLGKKYPPPGGRHEAGGQGRPNSPRA